MALSGFIYGSFSGVSTSWARPVIYWSATQNIGANSSTITASLRYYKYISGVRSFNLDAPTVSINIGGNTASAARDIDLRPVAVNGYTTVWYRTRTLEHKSDGNLSVTISASGSTGVSLGNITGLSGKAVLNNIPRVSEPSLDKSSVAYGSSIKITTNRKSTAFTHTIKYSNEGSTGTIATGVGDSYTYTVPLSHMGRIPSKTSSTYRLTIDTISGGSVVGTKTLSFTATVPTSYKPTVNTPTHSDTNSSQYNKYKHYVQHHSKSKFTATYEARGYATITSVRFDLGGGKVAVTRSGGNITKTTASYTTPTLTFHTQGNSSSPTNSPLYLKVTVTDSRGRSTTSGNSAAMHIARYDVPRVDSFSAYRINTSGVRDPSGESIRVNWKITIAGVGGNNNATYKWSYRSAEQTTAPSTQTFSLSRPSSPQSNGDYVLTGNSTKTGISSHLTWYVDFTVTDTVTGRDVTRSVEVPTGFVTMSFLAGGKGVAIGKEATRNGFEVAMDAHFNNGIGIPDTRDVISVPEDLPGRAISFEFKRNESVGNPPVTASPAYSHIINFAGWNSQEGSGGWPTQISVGASSLAVRQATSATTWGAWIIVGGSAQSPSGSAVIPANTNLNSYRTPGFYHSSLSADMAKVANHPTSGAGALMVLKHAGTSQFWVNFHPNDTSMYVRNEYGGSWGAWSAVGGNSSVAWSEVTSKPSTFAPSSHTHPYQQLARTATGVTGSINNSTWTRVSFGKTFTSIPAVVATGVNSVAGDSFAKIRNRNTTGFEIIVGGVGASNVFNWIALLEG